MNRCNIAVLTLVLGVSSPFAAAADGTWNTAGFHVIF